MACIKILIVLAVASLNLAVVSGRVGLDELVTNHQLSQGFFKESFLVRAMSIQTIGKLRAVISLDRLNGARCIFM